MSDDVDTVEVPKDDLDLVLEEIAVQAGLGPSVPEDVDEAAQRLEEIVYGDE